MGRRTNQKLLTTLPDDYSTEWLERLDKRTKISRAIGARVRELEADAGGAEGLSAVKRSLIRHCVWLDALTESYEIRIAAGEPVDVGGFTQSLNSLIGLFRMLGLERKARRTETLDDLMKAAAKDDPA
jgi:hypothetical protein